MTNPGNKKYAHPISQAFGRILRDYGLTEKYNGWMVVTKWAEIVGAEIARQAQAERYEDGTLYVVVDNAAWRQQLAMKHDELLHKIKSYPFGYVIKQLRLHGRRKGF